MKAEGRDYPKQKERSRRGDASGLKAADTTKAMPRSAAAGHPCAEPDEHPAKDHHADLSNEPIAKKARNQLASQS